MNFIRKILSKLIVVIMVIGVATTAFGAVSNAPMPDVGDNGTWATENNRQLFVSELTSDVDSFSGNFQSQLVQNYVPIEAKIGLMFMNAMSFVADVLDSSLVRFVIIFMFVVFAFWIAFETYNMMISGKGKTQELFTSIAKKGLLIVVWVIVLRFGPAQIFMWIMGPIISVATYVSDIILNSVAHSAGVTLPDTCAAIREYAAAHTSANSIIDATAAADMMCVPTRLSGFCYTAVATGLQWMKLGIGHSAFTFVVGLVFVVMFIVIAWKFAFIALGVIADLFLGVMMLPFTAINETVGKTSYKGMVGDIFNKFLSIFSVSSIESLVNKFINAAVYFVSLSIVVAFCAALMSSIIPDLSGNVPALENQGFWITLLVAGLTLHFANRAQSIAKDISGGMSVNTGFGDRVRGDITTMWNKTYGTAKSWWKIIRDGKK